MLSIYYFNGIMLLLKVQELNVVPMPKKADGIIVN